MADITVNLDTEGFVVPSTETASSFKAGFPSEEGLLLALGTTAERQIGYMEVQGVNNWYSKLTGTYPITYTPDGTGIAGNWPGGPTGSWVNEWWCAHNYLRYGGKLCVTGTGENSHTDDGYTTLTDPAIAIDCIFGAAASYTVNNKLMNISTGRNDCIAICSVGITQDIDGDTSRIHAFPATGVGNKNVFFVAGQKLHLKTSNTFEVNEDDTVLETTLLSPDAGGCFARTDISAKPWFSPAGFTRGRILDVVRMEYTINETNASFLYDNQINPVRTFPGEGTFLFGDKTRRTSDENVNFTYVNVSRLFLYLQRILANLSRRFLFEINNAANRAAFINAATPILRSVQGAGGITDFNIVCDEVNNPTSVIDANEFVADIYIKPAKSIETITLRFTNKSVGQTISGGSISQGSSDQGTTDTSSTNTSGY